jgi:hypothetical protein
MKELREERGAIQIKDDNLICLVNPKAKDDEFSIL